MVQGTLSTSCHRGKLESTYRLMCLRVACAYRTVSYEAVCVLAGMMPISIIVKEDVECFDQRDTRGIRNTIRSSSMARWQREWSNNTKGRWTHRLIPELAGWINRRHGEVTFHLTQILSGHGCFRQYLHRFGYAESPMCPACTGAEESAEHVFFTCPRFERVRYEMLAISGMDTTPENIVRRMCENREIWDAVITAASQIVSILQGTNRRETIDVPQLVNG